jgi:hypothetical protein
MFGTKKPQLGTKKVSAAAFFGDADDPFAFPGCAPTPRAPSPAPTNFFAAASLAVPAPVAVPAPAPAPVHETPRLATVPSHATVSNSAHFVYFLILIIYDRARRRLPFNKSFSGSSEPAFPSRNTQPPPLLSASNAGPMGNLGKKSLFHI